MKLNGIILSIPSGGGAIQGNGRPDKAQIEMSVPYPAFFIGKRIFRNGLPVAGDAYY